MDNGDDASEAVREALEIGYRQIDTARAYGNVPHDGTAADEVERAAEDSLTQDVPLEETPTAMTKLRDVGRVADIGVRLESFDVFDFELSAEERTDIDADRPWAPDWDA